MTDQFFPLDQSPAASSPTLMSPLKKHGLQTFAQASYLRPIRFPVLDDGFVQLLDVMGDDISVVDGARVSYKGADALLSVDTIVDARRLIRRLMRERHTSAFEMVEVKLLVRVPMDCWRQWIRHRTANVCEYSTRYRPAIDARQKATTWRSQSKKNKQGSAEPITEWPEGWFYDPELNRVLTPSGEAYYGETANDVSTPEKFLTFLESVRHEELSKDYETMLKFGVAREQARKDLPLSTYTEAYWKCDLHNILHFLGLRMDSHAQQEIRDYANVIGYQIIAKLFPLVWEAFIDYQMNGITFSGPECVALSRNNILIADDDARAAFNAAYIADKLEAPESEKADFEYKLARIGYPSGTYDGKAPYSHAQ